MTEGKDPVRVKRENRVGVQHTGTAEVCSRTQGEQTQGCPGAILGKLLRTNPVRYEPCVFGITSCWIGVCSLGVSKETIGV